MPRLGKFKFDDSSSSESSSLEEEEIRRKIRVHRRPRDKSANRVRAVSVGGRSDPGIFIGINNELHGDDEKRGGRSRKHDAEKVALEAQLKLHQRKLKDLMDANLWDEMGAEHELYRRRRKQLESLLRDNEKEQELLQNEREKLRKDRHRAQSQDRGQCWTRDEIENELAREQLRQLRQKEANKQQIEDAILLERIRIIEEEEKQRKRERKIRKKIEAERAEAEAAELERQQLEKQLKEDAIREYKRKEAEKELKQREEEAQAQKDFYDKLKAAFCAAGLTEDEMKDILTPKKDKKKDKEKDKHKKECKVIEPKPKEIDAYAKVHHRFMSEETLETYGIPFEVDPSDADYLLIQCWIPEDLQQVLFEHTRRQREQLMLPPPPPPPTHSHGANCVQLKVNDKKRDRLFLVRTKKEPKARVVIER
ncbi:hypothetical protein PRK78_001170 [Emydomyces testavorans]|uniref:Uncharacterized protein n=1 Tax=Emydomyces testavorans TaxID=2070801 RepID=A0AAF0IGF8_9EURO|nr:hypothetical protein PRK78_001170 [Emydomyces testavorans]